MGTRGQFARAVLLDPAVARPTTDENVAALLAWMRSEEGDREPSPYGYNPFNTTEGAPGATEGNTAGVKNYPDWRTGVHATVVTLTNGLYAPVVDALQNGHDAVAVVEAVAGSPWGSKPSAETLAEVYNGGAHDALLVVGDDGPDEGTDDMTPEQAAMLTAIDQRTSAIENQLGDPNVGVLHDLVNDIIPRLEHIRTLLETPEVEAPEDVPPPPPPA